MADSALVRDRLKAQQSVLTAAERKLAALLDGDAAVAGLQSITRLAEEAQVSSATVVRLARKLGFSGFPELQEALRHEIADRIKQPLAKLDAAAPDNLSEHILNRFAVAVSSNLNRTLDRIDPAVFDAVVARLSDPGASVRLLGGRITRSNAHYFYNHLQIIRPGVLLLDSSPSAWPQMLLDLDAQSVLVIFDIRRYEKSLERLAELAVRQGAQIVLFTDQWGSPIERRAAYSLRTMVEVPSSWDSTLALNFLIEALVAQVQRSCSDSSVGRIKAMEAMIGESRIFGGGAPG